MVKSWGFHYLNKITWIKKGKNGSAKMGLGVYVRNTNEVILIAKRGDFRRPETAPLNIFYANHTDHSRKPIRSYRIIEESYPDASRIELFARNVYPGWTGVGNEAEPMQ